MNLAGISGSYISRLAAVAGFMALLFTTADAAADNIFKCKSAGGAMHYQSTRCDQTDEVSHWSPKVFTATPYKPAAIVVRMGASGGYTVKGEIEGVAVDMLVDTGASDVAIPRALAERLNLPHGRPQQFSTANGLTMGYKTVIRFLKVGDFTLTNVEASVATNLPGGVLLGQTALGRLKVEQSKGELRLSAL